MSDAFQTYLEKQENSLFWLKSLPSRKVDECISDPKIQQDITKNGHLPFIVYVERTIVFDYAMLIDQKLRLAFNGLTQEEFKNPEGFERKDRSSKNQAHYYNVRNHLEYLIKTEIQQENPDAQLNAFRRWIMIAHELLNRHCYEGYLLVSVHLQLIATPQLINGLPKSIRKSYGDLIQLCASDKNHCALRNHIKTHQQKHDLPPIIFWHHAMTVLNCSMERHQTDIDALRAQKEKLKQDIAHYAHSHNAPNALTHLKNELVSVKRKIGKHVRSFNSELKQKYRILNEIENAQKIRGRLLNGHHEGTYSQIKHEYEAKNDRAYNTPCLSARASQSSKTEKISPSSTLYSNKLLPSFWTRKGRSAEHFWGEAFQARLS